MGASGACLRQQGCRALRSSFSRQRAPIGQSDGIGSSGICPRLLCSEAVSEYERDQPYYDNDKVTEKNAALHHALSQLVGDFGKESMPSLQRFYGSRCAPIISTGSLKLDLSLGIGGLPKGRIVEIYGQEASGKTTLGLHIVKEAQKLGGCCAFFDLENAMDPSLAEAIGVNTENLLLGRPNCAENSLSALDTLVKSGAVDVIIVDSVAALLPQHELDGVTSGTGPDLQSQLMTQALRKIHMSLCRSNTLLVFINQVRSNLRSFQNFGDAKEVTCGGNALKFYAAIRMRLMRRGLLKNKEEITGINISVQIIKNKLAPALKTAELEIGFGKGIHCEAEILEIASQHGVILKDENGYIIDGQVFKDGAEAKCYLAQNSEISKEILRTVRSQLFGDRESSL